ncbi:MAG: hypothetical protein P4N41_19930 [Negativicutes bacterium]|nr:hypothetical protein [Negativicutes bacterium]
MTGGQWEKLQAWQQAGPGRRVVVELDCRIPLFSPYESIPIETIIATAWQDGVASVPIIAEDIDRIDDRLREKAAEAARAAMKNSARLLTRLGAKK